MQNKNRKILKNIFANPAKNNIKWRDIAVMLAALGVGKNEGRGSRVRFNLNGVTASFHRPHPSPDTKEYVIKDMREFLVEADVCDKNGMLSED